MAMTFKASFIRLGFVLAIAMAVSGSSIAQRTYTTNTDFYSGNLQQVQCDSTPDQLQLNLDDCKTLSFLWVPNENGSISKVCTQTSRELGRYWVVPPDLPKLPSSGADNFGWPSRTAVCSDGSCWVANRTAGTVVKIGLLEAGQWIDRNGDGVCQTCKDANGDGVISHDEILPWGQDECVLYEVVLIDGKEAAYYPGDNPGHYDPDDYSGTSPSSLVCDANDDIWVSNSGKKRYLHVSGAKLPAAPSQITFDKVVNVAPHRPYGAVIDKYGALWSAGRDPGDVVRLDLSTLGIERIYLSHMAYGLALDNLDHLYVTGYTQSRMSQINVVTRNIGWTMKDNGLVGSRGAVCTPDNDVWVTNSGQNTVTRYDANQNLKATISVGWEPSGISVDSDGLVWVACYRDEKIQCISPITNTVIKQVNLQYTDGHYAYNNMAGSIRECIATNSGAWTIIYDSHAANTGWEKVTWNDQPGDPDDGEYPGAALTVSVQSSSDSVTFSPEQVISSGDDLELIPVGRYLKVIVRFEREEGAPSPILYDLTITPKQPVIDPDYQSFMLKQAYPGRSCEPNQKFAGFNGRVGSDVIEAVPGVLAIGPGGPMWPNYVTAAAEGKPYSLTNITLSKAVPEPEYVCTAPIGGKSVQQSGRNIRTWWPLMYELPGTKWTLTIYSKLEEAPYTPRQDVWAWQVDADLDSLKGIIKLFHQLPAGSCQVPLISSEVLYNKLLADIEEIKSSLERLGPSDPKIAEMFLDFILLVENNCVTVDCGACGAELGIRNTAENPACCKIQADAEYIAEALGVFIH